MKILVIEDNKDSRQLVIDILAMQGYEVLSAADGAEGLAKAQAEIPDLIVLDVNLPRLSGFEVCERLKADSELSRIPILMLTALSEIDDRVQGLGLGAEDYITKPFNPRELAARVEVRIRAKQVSDDLRATRDQILQTFEHYVAATVVEQLLDDPTKVALGGHIHIVTAFFADLEGFTTISEYADPETLFTVLNGYLSLVADAVIENRGTLDKFLGDGVMALFNAPLPQPEHALHAVRAALAAQTEAQQYQQSLPEKLRLNFRIGIHTGEALVGNVGTSRLRNYTAIGDTINTASRLEKSGLGGQILISDETYQHVKTQVVVREMGQRLLKGRETPILIYEVMEMKK